MPEQPKKPTSDFDFDDLEDADEVKGKYSGLINDLQTEIQNEKKGRCEERFLWIVVCVLLIDVLWLRTSSNTGLALIVLVLELIIFIVMARRMGIPEIAALIDKLLHSVGGKGT